MAHGAISRVDRLDKPYVGPKIWGQVGYPCEAIHEHNVELEPYVVDYNIAYGGVRYLFHCPFYSDAEPCDFGHCCYNDANAKYFAARAQYEKKLQSYEKNVAHLDELRADLWGHKKTK